MVLGLEVLTEYGENEKIGEPQALELVTDGGGEDVKPQPGAIPSNNFYGNKPNAQAEQQQQHQKQQNMVARSGPPKSVPNGGVVTFIEALSPYSHKWTIKARCTHKGDIKTWHNKNGEGKLFSANFLDESAEIRATGFNDQCDMLYDVIQENSVYYISSPCRVQPAKKQFSNLKHDYELTFERDTAVEKVFIHLGFEKVQNTNIFQGRRPVERAASTLQLHQHRRPASGRKRHNHRHDRHLERSSRGVASRVQNDEQAVRQARAHHCRQLRLFRAADDLGQRGDDV